jgi:hypothetical protein
MGRHVIRTKNFATDAADFILDEAHKALGERSEFRPCRNRAMIFKAS